MQNRRKNETFCNAGVSLEIYIQVIPSADFTYRDVEEREREREKERETDRKREERLM